MIGGEFEIDLSLQGNGFSPKTDTFYYASGRAALYQILLSLTPHHCKIWLPDWLCHTMVDAVSKAGFEYCFYELDEQFMATLNALDKCGFKSGDVLLMVNYFGLQDLTETAKAIKKAFPNSVVIEDDVQAYWVFAEKDNLYADYRFTSLRKSFAVPDGGLVKSHKPMPVVNGKNSFSPLKLKAGQMKQNRGQEGIRDEDYLSLFEEGEILIDDNFGSIMTDASKRLYAGVDINKAKQQRQANASCILKGLSELGIKPLIPVADDAVPLFVPIYLENRNEVRKRMFQHEVFCPVHWPLEGMNVKCGKDMTLHEMSLIVDHRYRECDMKFILELMN